MWTVSTIYFFPMVQWSKQHLWGQYPSLTDNTVTKGGHRGLRRNGWCRNPFRQWTASELNLLFLWCGNYSCTGIPLSWKLQPYDNSWHQVPVYAPTMIFLKKTVYWLHLAFEICLLFFHLTTHKTNSVPFWLLINTLDSPLSDFYPFITTSDCLSRIWIPSPLTVS